MSISRSEASPDWYATAFDSFVTSMPWADHPEADVDLALRVLEPPPGARFLDLACGIGSHALELSRRGFDVVGVDISEELIGIAEAEAELKKVDAEFVPADLRDGGFGEEFDVVLNLHDGAIGYFENDAENRRGFETIARALRSGGRNLVQIPNVLFAEEHLPERTWTVCSETIELLERHWNESERQVEGEMTPIFLDDLAWELKSLVFRQRLYTVEELRELYRSVGMTLLAVLDSDGVPIEPSDSEREIYVVAQKD